MRRDRLDGRAAAPTGTAEDDQIGAGDRGLGVAATRSQKPRLGRRARTFCGDVGGRRSGAASPRAFTPRATEEPISPSPMTAMVSNRGSVMGRKRRAPP